MTLPSKPWKMRKIRNLPIEQVVREAEAISRVLRRSMRWELLGPQPKNWNELHRINAVLRRLGNRTLDPRSWGGLRWQKNAISALDRAVEKYYEEKESWE